MRFFGPRGLAGVRAVVVAVVLGVVVAGCGDSQSAPVPSVVVTPGEPTATPVPTPPELPWQAIEDEPSDDGAHHFIRYWFKALAYATLTGDVGPVEAVTEPESEWARFYIDPIVDHYATGGHIEGGVWEVQDFGPPLVEDGRVDGYPTFITVAETSFFDADGSLVKIWEATERLLKVYPRWVDGEWKLAGFGKFPGLDNR